MRFYLLAAGIFVMATGLMACSDSDTGGGGGDGGDGTTSMSTGTGGTGGAGGAGGSAGGAGGSAGGAGGAGGGAGGAGGGSAITAEHLGEVCNAMKACPEGYSCAVLTAGAANGFCTLECMGQLDTKTCENGFAGPGKGICNITLKDPMDNTFQACGIACGDQWMPALPETCPTGLTCQDLIGVNMKPDGKKDLCAP